jgi:hypothetical protein
MIIPELSYASRKRVVREDGFVLIIVLALMAVALLIGWALVAESISANSLTTHDTRQRRAQQAADAGVQAQLYQQGESQAGTTSFDLNGGLLGTSNFLDCMEPQLNASLQITGVVQASLNDPAVCPGAGGTTGSALVPDPVGNHDFYEAEFFPGANPLMSGDSEVELQPKIVSLGYDTSGSKTVYSREEAILSPVEPLPVLGGNDNLNVNGVTITGGILGTLLSGLGLSSLVTTVNGDIEAANNISLPTIDAGLNLTLSNGLLGVVQLGKTGTLSPSNGITVAQVLHDGPPPEQPVTVSSSTPDCPSTNVNCVSFGSYYNATTDDVTVPAGDSTTIPGGVYIFCNFNDQGTVTANASSTAAVQIFIDNPNSTRCTGNGTPVLSSIANSVTGHDEYNFGNFIAPGGISNGPANVTGVLGPSGLQIYLVGDDPQASNPYDDDTYVQIGNPATGRDGGLLSSNLLTEEMVVYAPTSEVSMTTAQCTTGLLATLLGTVCVPGTFVGNLIGDDVSATALTVTQDLDLGNYPLYSGVDLYHVQQYVECSPVSSLAGTTADTNGC